jgi:ElaB/YqjD/DUF883 family membrane-anchored ribosome-binding protein
MSRLVARGVAASQDHHSASQPGHGAGDADDEESTMTTQTGPESRRRGRSMNGGTAGETTAREMGDTSQTTTGATGTGATSTGKTQPEGDRLEQAATGLADQATRTAEAQASNMMTKAGETLDQVARAIRDAGQGIRQERPEIADIADTTAQRVQDASTYLREHDAREVIDSVQDYARRQPAVIVAGGLALGLLAGRFLRSGTPPQTGSDANRMDYASRDVTSRRSRSMQGR